MRQVKSQNNRHLGSQKNLFNLRALSLGIYAPEPQVSTYRPHILREVRI